MPVASFPEAGDAGSLDLFPGNDIVRMTVVVLDPPLELSALGFGERDGRIVRGDAVPDLLHESETLLDGKPVDSQRFD
jgi:hypothetical protein